MKQRPLALTVLCFILGGCVRDVRIGDLPDAEAPLDAFVAPDATEPDARALDASALDAPAADAPAPDAMPDSGPIDGGVVDYTFVLVASASSSCSGTLSGHEAAFNAITSTSVGLSTGAVTITFDYPRQPARIEGPAIVGSFGQTSLTLMQVPQGPPGAFTSQDLPRSSPGPEGTTLLTIILGIDLSMRDWPDFPAFVFLGYAPAVPPMNDTCSVFFEAHLTPR